MIMAYVRIKANWVEVGDRIAQSKTDEFHAVTKVRRNLRSVWITLDDGTRIRPHLDTTLWRIVPPKSDATRVMRNDWRNSPGGC